MQSTFSMRAARLAQLPTKFAPRALTRSGRNVSSITTSFDTTTTTVLRKKETKGPIENIFKIDGRVYGITGGGQGLGLVQAQFLAEQGAHAYAIDWKPSPSDEFRAIQNEVAKSHSGSLSYYHADVRDAARQDIIFEEMATKHGRMDGLVSAAAVQNVTRVLDYPVEKISEMMDINFKGVYLSARSCARQMKKHKTPGSMVLIGSMSGLIANKDLFCSVYNSSKGAVIQLGRSLAMEWGKEIDGKPIRVNVLCPGNIVTPMVKANFEEDPTLRAKWEEGNMLGRLSAPEEFRGAILYMLSDASSFMTGEHVVVDGGYTAW